MQSGYSILGLLLVVALAVIMGVYFTLSRGESREASVTNTIGAVDQAEQIKQNFDERFEELDELILEE